MKRPDGVTIIAVYEFLSAIPGLIGICAILVFAVSGTLAGTEGIGDAAVVLAVLGCVLLLIGVGALVSVITGWGLLGMKGWARWLAIVLAALSLLAFPIGTIFGALIIWYLLKAEVREAFEAAA